MDFLDHVSTASSLLLRSFGVFFVVMAVIFVHEFGHYLVGRLCGIKALVFSLGFGPKILSYVDNHGTQWRLALIPLGGYVKFVGDENEVDALSSSVHGSFSSAHAWKKAATVFAGPLFNVLLTVAILTFFFFSQGRIATEPVVGFLVKDAPAAQVGLMLGDRFIEMDGRRIESFEDLAAYVAFHGGNPIEFKMERMGRVFTTVITPIMIEQDDGFGNRVLGGAIGVAAPADPNNPTRLDPAYEKRIHYNFMEAVVVALERTMRVATQTVFLIGRLIGGKEDRCQLSGPSKTVKIAWRVSEAGFISLLNFAAFLSIGIGLVNLFPIPPLDGGHLLFHVVEALSGSPVSAEIRQAVFYLGFCVVLLFMIFALFNDYFCWLS
ncbi:RIP metalloprotease RseP [Bartonella sp. CB178]|uniref:RIP metalloprotease RseP n=1 Tax=Bartonella sp. CB178 TaxID=3112255 RepID=UPI00300DE483